MLSNLGRNRCCIDTIGAQGAIGIDGPYGPIGTIGNTGVSGVTGPQGNTGICYRGPKGPQGAKGAQGGINGDLGAKGVSGTESGLNVHFSFLTNVSSSYSNVSFTDLTTLATTAVSNSITLDDGTYSIQYEISENFSDPSSEFYVRFNRGGAGLYYPFVFDPANSNSLVLRSNGTNLFGVGNDVITFSTPSPNTYVYTVELMQKSNSGSPFVVSNKTIVFNITLNPVS